MNVYRQIVLLSSFILFACQSQEHSQQAQYSAEIIRTNHHVAHISAADYPSLGFGEGYAAAEDHICNIAHSMVVARGERSKYHGMGENKRHFISDVVMHALDIPTRAADAFHSDSKEIKDWATGYADGYNHYLAVTGVDNIGSWCAGAAWVKPITAQDIYRRALTLANSGTRVPGMIASAKPPIEKKAEQKKIAQTTAELSAILEDEVLTLEQRYLGSNAWAFGKDRTENKRGLLLANPHYPWSGSNRFWEKHLTIPGQLNAYGVGLLGLPGVTLGFNEHVAWSHTVSDSERIVFYQLRLVDGNPTQYHYGDEIRSMTAKQLSVEVAGQDEPVSHTVWFSHYGPIVNLPGIGWNDRIALSMRDANFANYLMMAQWKDMSEAQSMDEFIAAHERWSAMPWVNTMATSMDGRAVYMDNSNVGNLSDEAISLWKQSLKNPGLANALYAKRKFVVLDGSDERFEWVEDPEASIAGNIPFANKPIQDRSDYIFNANDSYWLTNTSAPMAEHSPLYGPHASSRTLRTRMNALLVANDDPMGYAGEDKRFSRAEMQAAIFANDSSAAQLLMPALLSTCVDTPSIMLDGNEIDLTSACSALAEFDLKFNLDSQGSVLFREWLTRYSYADTMSPGALFSVPFDVNEPVNTPHTLADKPLALKHLAQAAAILTKAGVSLNATMGDTQFAYRAGEIIPIHGGKHVEGVANVIGQRVYDTQAFQERGIAIDGSQFLKDKGYPITYGTSFIMALSFTDAGPEAEAFMTYSQSGDPNSVFFTDQTKLFSDKQWRPVLYRPEAIKANTLSKKTVSAVR